MKFRVAFGTTIQLSITCQDQNLDKDERKLHPKVHGMAIALRWESREKRGKGIFKEKSRATTLQRLYPLTSSLKDEKFQ